MSRKNIVAGNWKMNKTLTEGVELTNEIVACTKDLKNGVQIILGTPFIHITEVVKLTANVANIAVSAQNSASEAKGAYTGEVSAEQIKSTGAEYVILGHSERRQYYAETNALLAKKVDLALANGLKPIYCIGELLPEREAGKHFDVVGSQLKEGVFHLSAEAFKNVVIAYEPVWAIGTGVTASSAQAQEIHAFIRSLLVEKYGSAVAEDTSILYGGSCNAQNANELFANKDVDGGLIGGASLKAADFLAIITAF